MKRNRNSYGYGKGDIRSVGEGGGGYKQKPV